MKEKIKIAFASTAYGPLWRPAVETWMRVIARTQKYLLENDLGEIGGLGITDRMYVHSADNQLVQDLLKDENLTHLFHTEMDMLLPDDTIIKLLQVDQDIVSGLYFIRNGNGQPCLYKRSFVFKENPYAMTPVTLFPEKDKFKLNGCPGLGCVLIKRNVFEKVSFPWFDLKESTYGSDIFFYTKVLEKKIDVWVDPTVKCAQIDYTVVGIDDYHKRIEEDEKFAGSGYIVGCS